jgi:hypothetical protein
MPLKFSYATQKNIPCRQNAQNWYLKNAIQKVKTSKNPIEREYYISIINYYYNGRARNIY